MASAVVLTMLAAPARATEPRADEGATLDMMRRVGAREVLAGPKTRKHGLALLNLAANAGSAGAAYDLGYFFCCSRVLVRDFTRAMTYYRRAAAHSSVPALVGIGTMYDHGQGVPVDHGAARRLYDEALAAGSVVAETAIGEQYDHGLGVPVDWAEALRWYRRGAAGGDTSAMTDLGYAYQFGRGVPLDYKEALAWYTKAFADREPAAEVNLANMFFKGQGVPQDRARGLALLMLAADADNPEALNQLATIEMDAPHPNNALIMRFLRHAVVTGGASDMLDLAIALEAGRDGKPDFVEANFWYRRAATGGDDLDADARALAAFGLGQNLLHGRGIDENPSEARAWLRKAADGGSNAAPLVLASMMIEGKGGPAAPDEALALLARAGSKPDGAAADLVRASLLAQRGDVEQARTILEARAASTTAAVEMINPWDCNGGVRKRSALYDLTALAAHPDATSMRQAAKDGDGRADLWLGEAMLRDRRSDAAEDMLDAAADTGLPAAHSAVAAYNLGTGDRHDIANAAHEYRLALEAGDESAVTAFTVTPPRFDKTTRAALDRAMAADARSDGGHTKTLDQVIADAQARAAGTSPTMRAFCAVARP